MPIITNFFLVKIRLLTNLNIFCEFKQHWVPIRFIPALLNGIVNCLLRHSQSIHTDNNIKKKKIKLLVKSLVVINYNSIIHGVRGDMFILTRVNLNI